MLTKAFFAAVCGQYGEKNNAGQDKIGRPGTEMLNLNTLLASNMSFCLQPDAQQTFLPKENHFVGLSPI